ncbi:MAG: homocysteine S-methyltransferase family protein [Anaerolineales bacterium]|nr:homocysteine S-methyltransferase family protein [Anaerolineales bacterium]
MRTPSILKQTDSTNFRQRLGSGTMLLDGATGTELERRGINISTPLWSARAILDAPDVLLQIHLDYLQAGAEMITANTFRVHQRNLQLEGLGQHAKELVCRAVEIAQRAIKTAGGNAYVAGCISPLEDSYSPQYTPPVKELLVEHRLMSQHLTDCGVDVLLVETMNTIREAIAATKSAVATGWPTLTSIACNRNGYLLSGELIPDAVQALSALCPDGILINCTPAPDLNRLVKVLHANTSLPVGAYGNVGFRNQNGYWIQTDAVQPEIYAEYAREWRASGATIIGGCCGTEPAHIAALRKTLSS